TCSSPSAADSACCAGPTPDERPPSATRAHPDAIRPPLSCLGGPMTPRHALVALPLALATACPPDEELPAILGECPPESTLTWDDAEPLFAQYCTHCHSTELAGDDRNGAPEGMDFNIPEPAQQGAFLVWSMLWSGQMPA